MNVATHLSPRCHGRMVAGFVLGAVVVGGLGAAGISIAAIPDSHGVIHGCYTSKGATKALSVISGTGACPSGDTSLNWNQTGPQGPSGVVSMTQYAPGGAAAATSGWAFLGAPPEEAFANTDTAAEVTATVDEASANGNEISDVIGVCYEPVGGSTVTDVSYIEPQFAAATDSYFAQTVSGVVGDLAAGTYSIGLCAEDQSDVYNGLANVTITMAQTASGVTYDGTRSPVAGHAGPQ